MPEPAKSDFLGHHDPKLGVPNDAQRRCGFRVGGPVGKGEQLCGKPATVHLIFRWVEPTLDDPYGYDHGYTCDDHYEDAIKLKHAARHPLFPACGMPGSRVHMPENECRFDDLLVIADSAAVEEGVHA